MTIPTRAELMAAIVERFRAGEGFALATINLDHVVKLAKPGPFADGYRAQDFVVADGNPIVWLSNLAGKPVELLPGSDLVPLLAEEAAAEGVTVALLGATPEVLEKAARRLEARVSGLTVVAQLAPGLDFDPEGDEAGRLLAELGQSGAGLCFLAIGAPKQECMAARGRKELPGVGFVSIGAGLDFLAGSQRRAPLWMRKLALEWIWRLWHHPGRLARRYFRCAMILPRLCLDALRQRNP
ncbi:MAG: WecB/TagA/CpsF family glycosyltransferase [Pseudomonadota bacterium]